MEIGMLLEELINIAQIPKTDFAISMNMTPSGLSKILTGKRLPLLKEKKAFCRQAANYFAEAIYCPRCYLKFESIFPVIYDFSSKYELEMFLAYAIQYALDKGLAAENNKNVDYPDNEISFLGKKIILNMFCVIISDSIINDNNILLDLYSTLPLFSQLYSDIFRRIKIVSLKNQKNVSFNHFFDMSSLETSYDEYNIDVLLSIVKAQQYVDLNLWENINGIDSSFLLLKGQFLLLFSIQIDGTPLMVLITHKSYLAVFFSSLIKRGAKKISYNRSEANAALEADPSLIDKLINRRIDAVYNFISIGYLIDMNELENIEITETVKKSILKLFHDILIKDTTFFVTIDAMMGIYFTGKAIVPLIGAVDITPDKRIPYLRRFEAYINEKNIDKIRIINSELPKVAVLCSPGLSLVYLIDHEYDFEKIHCFETDMINNILGNEVADSDMKILDFSSDLWKTYIDELSKSKIHS